MTQGKSYSVINTHKAMLLQTLKLLGNSWCDNPTFIPRFMKGYFNQKPPVPRYNFTWPVSKVLNFLGTLFPLEKLSLKMLTLKAVALVALSCATRAQTIKFMNLSSMRVYDDRVCFAFKDLLKTSRPGKRFCLNLYHNDDESLCTMHTLLYYLDRTKKVRKSQYVFVSYCTYLNVTTSTIARWLKEILKLSGVDISVYKAHSFRGAAASAAFLKGCSLKDILSTADWSSAKNLKKYYLRDIDNTENGKAKSSELNKFSDIMKI